MRAATGASENLSSGPSFGRPKCEHIVTAAPFSSRYLIVGTANAKHKALIARLEAARTKIRARSAAHGSLEKQHYVPEARMRVSSVIVLPSSGTLRSQRMRTFLPLRSASDRSATDFFASGTVRPTYNSVVTRDANLLQRIPFVGQRGRRRTGLLERARQGPPHTSSLCSI